jgi:CheY-like chemotaxis protein
MTRILVVEPKRPLRAFIAGILGDFGHHVVQCADLGEARESLRRAPFDVVATDLVLRTGELPVPPPHPRVLTLNGRPAPRADGDKYGRPLRLYDKPFRLADLRRLVAAVEPSGALKRAG